MGAASQTLAAIILIGGGERDVFASAATIAAKACRNQRSVERDIAKLVDTGWLENHGRQRFALGVTRVRRTVTLKLTPKARQFARPYHRLPVAACVHLRRWSDRLVYAAVVSVALLVEDLELDCGEGREAFSLRRLSAATGLSRPSVVGAKKRLESIGLITVVSGAFEWNGEVEYGTDSLFAVGAKHAPDEAEA